MTYYDGFVIACPKAKRDAFIRHAATADPVFIELGARRVVECWEDSVPDGKRTDLRRAVQAGSDEAVIFSWIEWPDKKTRDACFAKAMAPDFSDPRMDPAANPMPFDGKRMIFGGFEGIVEEGAFPQGAPDGAYVQGFVIPSPNARREDYRQMAAEAWEMFREFGALGVVETWGDDVPDGKLTDMRRAVEAGADENVVFSWMIWPSREACDAAAQKMESDERMKMPDDPPFDPQRMIYGGFTPVVDLKGEE